MIDDVMLEDGYIKYRDNGTKDRIYYRKEITSWEDILEVVIPLRLLEHECNTDMDVMMLVRDKEESIIRESWGIDEDRVNVKYIPRRRDR